MAEKSGAHANVILSGGSGETVPDTERIQFVADLESKLKVFMGNRYEHFMPTSRFVRHEGRELRVFDWAGRTYVAE
ncbi:DUF5988 family protein [Streptomyces sp. NBC_01538]|uniref:DUF5988 family protein n=1 Tax=Streptomyces sp. NBC_01538 TaxID=2903897 RepID=UPI0038642A15